MQSQLQLLLLLLLLVLQGVLPTAAQACRLLRNLAQQLKSDTEHHPARHQSCWHACQERLGPRLPYLLLCCLPFLLLRHLFAFLPLQRLSAWALQLWRQPAAVAPQATLARCWQPGQEGQLPAEAVAAGIPTGS